MSGKRGEPGSKEIMNLTAEISKAYLWLPPVVQNLGAKAYLRDHMNDFELIFTMLEKKDLRQIPK